MLRLELYRRKQGGADFVSANADQKWDVTSAYPLPTTRETNRWES
jgi:hypothetical protein